MFNIIKNLFDSEYISPLVNFTDIDNCDLKEIFFKNGFFIIKNFFDENKQNFYLSELNKTLNIESSINSSKVLSDALNYNNKFLDLVSDNSLNKMNSRLLGNNYIFLQNLDFHANQNAHQWHRDISSKDGKVVEINNKEYLIIKYAIYLKIASSAFFVVKNSHCSNKGSDVFGKNLYDMKEYKFYDVEDYEKSNTGDIIYYKPNVGDLIGFDYRILHTASNVKEDGTPTDENLQKEKKVIWPTYGKRNFFTESIYQYAKFIRKDFDIMKYQDEDTYNLLKNTDHLPDTYENISEDHIKWCKKNLMYSAELDDLIYESPQSEKLIEYRKKLIGIYSQDPKYSLQLEKQKKYIVN